MGNLVDHAERELRRAGFFDADSDYGGMLAEAVLKLVRVHEEEGHSGFSHARTLQLFVRVADFKTLSPLTSDPAEWTMVDPGKAWQNKRDPSAFSEDGGETWYSVDERPRRLHKSAPPMPSKESSSP